MSDNSSSRSEGRGYNSDVGSYSTPQVSSSFAALADGWSSEPLQATPLATKAPSSQPQVLAALSSRRPPQSKVVRADVDRCCSDLSERELVSLRTLLLELRDIRSHKMPVQQF
ncbi:hypothetical protein LIER_30897 [Lithospermum erythrorhizon]|uniref:Uncharacterized protein n=1 Tax=Lithospermum erythrorhizon TaxID=34254 RepID=A0AAV3RP78_LITER